MFESPSAGKALAEVAHQHARLAQHIKAVRHTLEQGGAWEGLAQELDSVIEVLADHFADEQALMKERAYPAMPEHVAQHAAILGRVRSLREECENKRTELAPVLLDFLQQSLERHENTVDRAFEQFIAEMG
ncbi:MAG: hemerythrin family protein [Polyangiaceae bacterium]